MKRIEIEYECKDCDGTGLYVGMAEHDGAAVVCRICKGSGKAIHVFEYEEFSGKKTRGDEVKRVYETNPGIAIGENAKIKLEDFGGMTYSDWLSGVKFTRYMEDRKFTCPKWWYQCVKNDLQPKWDKCDENIGRRFSDCPRFGDKSLCWARFDKENPVKEEK